MGDRTHGLVAPARRYLYSVRRVKIQRFSRQLVVSQLCHVPKRDLASTSKYRTDGVFRALTDMRTPSPWIDALRTRQNQNTSSSDAVKSPRDLTPKKMSDSEFKVILPLAQDKWLSDTYLNVDGRIRLGAIFMDLDAMSGVIAYQHTGEGVVIVTAAVDRITIENPLTELCDLEYSGQVTYATGRSSMEITCKVTRVPPNNTPPNKDDVLLTCSFSMVALDPKTRKPTPVPGLQIENTEDQATFKLGESRSLARKAQAAQSLLSHHPNESESALIHGLWLEDVAARDRSGSSDLIVENHTRSMASTVLKTANIMQPQYRNRHQWQIFGGFLLKQTFELAFCCAANFSHARPTFVSADPCTFLNPVPVGSVLYLSATVVYTESPANDRSKDMNSNSEMTRVQIRVDSRVRNVEHDSPKPTGKFHYTFTVPKRVSVMATTYQEMMMYLDGRRRSKDVGASIDASNAPKEGFVAGDVMTE